MSAQNPNTALHVLKFKETRTGQSFSLFPSPLLVFEIERDIPVLVQVAGDCYVEPASASARIQLRPPVSKHGATAHALRSFQTPRTLPSGRLLKASPAGRCPRSSGAPSEKRVRSKAYYDRKLLHLQAQKLMNGAIFVARHKFVRVRLCFPVLEQSLAAPRNSDAISKRSAAQVDTAAVWSSLRTSTRERKSNSGL
jgi:hypothetical protein